jgi:hypothetical protein
VSQMGSHKHRYGATQQCQEYVVVVVVISGTTALMGASCHYYGSIASVSAYEEQVASLPPQHRAI